MHVRRPEPRCERQLLVVADGLVGEEQDEVTVKQGVEVGKGLLMERRRKVDAHHLRTEGTRQRTGPQSHRRAHHEDTLAARCIAATGLVMSGGPPVQAFWDAAVKGSA